MSMLFYIDEDQTTVLHPACVKLCPELAVLSQDDVLFVVLAFDHRSPYRQLPERQRIQKAMMRVYGDNVPGMLEKPSMKYAIEAYKGLQYDPKIELVRRYQEKINKLLTVLDEEDSATAIGKTTQAIDSLRKQIMELEREITDNVVKKGVIKGNVELSYIEELQSTWKNYQTVIALKK